MPKQKITKDMVIEAAFELARKGGLEQVTVRDIAEALECSVQPIYSYCQNMEGLRQDVIKRVKGFVTEYISSHLDENDFFRSTGHAYIHLAKEEPNIFKMFVLSERTEIDSLNALYESETNPQIAGYIADDLNISTAKARSLHLHMLIYTVGIGTILANTTPGISSDEIYSQLETAYLVFLKQALEK